MSRLETVTDRVLITWAGTGSAAGVAFAAGWFVTGVALAVLALIEFGVWFALAFYLLDEEDQAR